jgi:hypothetical protein
LPIRVAMGRSATRLYALVGCTLGGFAPELWGGSALSLSSILFSVLGGIAGVWIGLRLTGM